MVDCPIAPGGDSSALPGAASKLVPLQPATALICRYDSLRRDDALLAFSRIGPGAELRELVAMLNSAVPDTLLMSKNGVSCPTFDQGEVDVYLAAGSRHIGVRVHESGCWFASNGTFRLATVPNGLEALLVRLAPGHLKHGPPASE